MSIELNQATFRRLVQLYIVSGVGSLLAMVPQFVDPFWLTFSEGFDALVRSSFGETYPSRPVVVSIVVIFAGLLAWLIASMVGLLWLQRWARLGSWLPLVIFFVGNIALVGSTPSFTTPIDDFVGLVDSALLGAILVIAYAKGLGADWFAKRAVE